MGVLMHSYVLEQKYLPSKAKDTELEVAREKAIAQIRVMLRVWAWSARLATHRCTASSLCGGGWISP